MKMRPNDSGNESSRSTAPASNANEIASSAGGAGDGLFLSVDLTSAIALIERPVATVSFGDASSPVTRLHFAGELNARYGWSSSNSQSAWSSAFEGLNR